MDDRYRRRARSKKYVPRRRSSVNFGAIMHFCPKIYYIRIIYKIPEILHDICPKNIFFPEFWEARAPLPPVSYVCLYSAVCIMPNTHHRRDETVLSRQRRQCEHNSRLGHDDCRRIRSTIWKLTKQTP